jgi:carbamoyltransferase
MVILGISALYHDAAAAIVVGGAIIAATQEERFTRVKNDLNFPIESIQYCLKEANCHINDVDYVVFYDKPLLKFERLLETYLAFAPSGFKSFLLAIPIWLKQKIFFKRIIYNGLSEMEGFDKRKLKLLFTEHHLSHAASAYFASNFEESAILTIDGVGEWATASICKGEGNSITKLKEMHFPHSLGLLYSSFTYYLGFKVNSGEYKLMGLAPYGEKNSVQVNDFIKIIKEQLVKIHDDGSIYMNQVHFNYATGLHMTNNKSWKHLFGFARRSEKEEITQAHCNLALAIQLVTEECVMKMAKHTLQLCNSENLCLAGGVALNCVSNGKLIKQHIAEKFYIQPASGDSGGALGAALAVHYIYLNNPKVSTTDYDGMKGSYLGPSYSNIEIERVIQKYKAFADFVEDEKILFKNAAAFLKEGNVVGWFQGRMEFGPRALGNRSILADARNGEMQRKLNLKIKYRENFRPFAPCVIEEDAQEYFELDQKSPFMLYVADVKLDRRTVVSTNSNSLNLIEKINTVRSDIPAVTHVDNSARIQTVNKLTNPKLYNLLSEFKKLTNCSLLVNTSFNVRGEPIVCKPEDAYLCFMNTEMDYLVMENFIFDKKQQPFWEKQLNKFEVD